MLLRIHWFIYSHDLAEVILVDPSRQPRHQSTMVSSSLALTTVQLVLLLDSPSSSLNRAPVTEDESRPG